MRIALITTKETPRAHYFMECFQAGARQHGDTCVTVSRADDLDILRSVDCGVQVCMVNYRPGGDPIGEFRRRVWTLLGNLGKRRLVFDTGFVKNQYDYAARQLAGTAPKTFSMADPSTYAIADGEIYYELAFDGIKGLGDHCCTGSEDSGRWRTLGCKLQPWRANGKYILLLTQPLHGQSSQDVNIFAWYGATLTKVKQHARLPIMARVHPRVGGGNSRTFARRLATYQSTLRKSLRAGSAVTWLKNSPLRNDLAGARLAIAYSTNAMVDAVLAGVPVYVGSPACMAWPMREANISSALAQPRRPERDAWVNALAYSQYNCAEMRAGTAWAHYRPHALKPPTSTIEQRMEKVK